MNLKLQLVRDGEIVFEIPLSPPKEEIEELTGELDAFEEHIQRISEIFTALSSRTRLMMMKRIMQEGGRTINFTDFMRDLELNPKLVWENTKKLREGGLVEKIGRGRYRCSEFGKSSFITIGFTLRRLIEELEDFDNI